MKKIYFAGPDVFEPNAKEVGEQLKQIASEFGFVGLFPFDNEIPEIENPYKMAKAIRDANLQLIRLADIVVANLNPFRGLEPDSGTVFEVGYAVAQGKAVYGYAEDRREMIVRVRQSQQLSKTAIHCRDGKVIEDFGLSHNLMLLDVMVAADVRSCLEFVAEQQKGLPAGL